MRPWLTNLYLTPEKQGYKNILFLQRHYKIISAMLFSLVIAYPVFDYLFNYYSYRNYLQQQQQLNDSLLSQQKQLESLIQHQQHKQADQQFTQLNQQIKTLIEKYQINVEQIQWRFEQGKQIYLLLNQQTVPLFQFITELDHIKKLAFSKIVLFKLNQQRRIQLQAELHFE